MQGMLKNLLAHLRWADEQTFAALAQQQGAPSVAHERFMHVVAAEHVWLCRIRGEGAKVAVWPQFTTDGCQRLMAQNHREFDALVAIDDGALRRQVHYTTSDGRPFIDTVADILMHVAMHGSWHRGQIALLMRQAGGVPVASDYIAFVRGAPAARAGRG